MNKCLQIIVQGRVQGVYFRVYTQKRATKLKLQGYVRNLSNGDVEIIACGDEAALRKLVVWCHRGPLLAKVSNVIVADCSDSTDFSGFEIR